MVEISHRPLKEIVVYEAVKRRNAEELARLIVAESGPMQSQSIRWADGIAFRVSMPPIFLSSETLAKEFLDGKIFVSIDYAPMPVYKVTINSAEEKVLLPVIDDSVDPNSKELVAWIKKNHQQQQ
jgi:hypothetical protein